MTFGGKAAGDLEKAHSKKKAAFHIYMDHWVIVYTSEKHQNSASKVQ